jgi:hypothetical protein
VATRVPVLLEGGPCAGRKTTARRGGDLLDNVTCKGVEYGPTARVTKENRVIYTTLASQQPKPPPSASSVAAPMKAHHSWHGMLSDVFVHAPKELMQSARARKAMHHLTHRRGLR